MRTEGFGGFIRPTPLERAAGRLMRAPDHDSSTGADSSGGGDDAGQSGADGKGDGASDTEADAATILSSAAADAGTGDGEGEGEGKKDGEKTDEAEKTADGPPEAYDLKVTVKAEDGTDSEVEIDKALLDEATPVLKDLGLTNDQANKLAPLAVKVQERLVAQQADDFAATKAEWAKTAQADPDIGGKNWKETTSLAAKALDQFVGPAETKGEDGQPVKNEFRQLLDETGLGNHPVMIRAWRDIGKAVAEDGTFARGSTTALKKSREEVMYPEDAPKK